MKSWLLLFLVVPLAGLYYAMMRVWHILPLSAPFKVAIVAVLVLCFAMFFLNFFVVDKLPMWLATVVYNVGNSSLVVLLYAVMLFALLDVGRLLGWVPSSFLHGSLAGTLTVVAVLGGLFTYAHIHYMHKQRVPLDLATSKPLRDGPLTIVLMSDLHVGYHNDVDELNRWVDMVNREKPDLVLIGGDIIDGHMRPLQEQGMAQSFRRIKAPVVACLGNHEYYSGTPQACRFNEEAGIKLLIDEAITIKGINIVGRDDLTNSRRRPLSWLMAQVDKSRFTVLLDHQPYHLEQAQRAGIDFQFSGHTHYGQVWPMSWLENLVYEKAFGPLTKGSTRYYVSSGLGIWGAKFRIGTQSEWVVARVFLHASR